MPILSSKITTKDLKKATGTLGGSISRLVIPLACILASAGLLILLIIPGIRGIKELREEKVEKEEELQKYEEKNRKLLTFAADEREIDKDLLLVKNALPDEEKIPELMTQMQMTSGEAGVPVSSLQYTGEKEKGGKEGSKIKNSSEVKLQIGVLGAYSQFQDFFKRIENASRVVLVNQFSIAESKEASMSATLSLSSFFLAPQTEQNIDTPITLDLTSPKFGEAIDKIKALMVYEVQVEEFGVGKENPFVE